MPLIKQNFMLIIMLYVKKISWSKFFSFFRFWADNLPLGGLICTPKLRAWSFATATLQRTFLSMSDSVRSCVSCRVTRRLLVPAQVHFPCDRKCMFIFPATLLQIASDRSQTNFAEHVHTSRWNTETTSTLWSRINWIKRDLRNISSCDGIFERKFNSEGFPTCILLSCNDYSN